MHPKRLSVPADNDPQTLAEHSLYFRGSHTRPYTVPTVEKIVERAKADHEPTPGYIPYRTANTAMGPGLTSVAVI